MHSCSRHTPGIQLQRLGRRGQSFRTHHRGISCGSQHPSAWTYYLLLPLGVAAARRQRGMAQLLARPCACAASTPCCCVFFGVTSQRYACAAWCLHEAARCAGIANVSACMHRYFSAQQAGRMQQSTLRPRYWYCDALTAPSSIRHGSVVYLQPSMCCGVLLWEATQ